MPHPDSVSGRAQSGRSTAGDVPGVSLGFVVADSEPEGLKRRCRVIRAAVPAAVRVELLLLDDHTNPRRRELVEVVESYGDSVRLVPHPGPSRSAVLDAVSQASGSELLVLGFGGSPPWASIGPALAELWADGADIATVGSDRIEGLRCGDGDDSGSWLASILGFDGPDGGAADRAGGDGRARLVMVRRWVARWLTGGIEARDGGAARLDIGAELAERADSLSLRTLSLDVRGAPATPE